MGEQRGAEAPAATPGPDQQRAQPPQMGVVGHRQLKAVPGHNHAVLDDRPRLHKIAGQAARDHPGEVGQRHPGALEMGEGRQVRVVQSCQQVTGTVEVDALDVHLPRQPHAHPLPPLVYPRSAAGSYCW
ncbi:hypothetical protein GCM10020219_045030 [Nonomuraea dietziae]